MSRKPDAENTTTEAATVDEDACGAGLVAELDDIIQAAVDGAAPAPAAEQIQLLFGDGQTTIPRPDRERLRRKYGFAIPSNEVVAAVAALGTSVLIEQSDAAAAIIHYPGRAVFMSWPCHNQDWAAHALRELQSGQALIYIGEPADGCTADADFFNILDSEFEIIATPAMASFPCIHDDCLIYRRKLQPAITLSAGSSI